MNEFTRVEFKRVKTKHEARQLGLKPKPFESVSFEEMQTRKTEMREILAIA